MAKSVLLRHPASGIVRKGHFGFSWTILFFNGIPMIGRGDFTTGLLLLIFNSMAALTPDGTMLMAFGVTYFISSLICAGRYNDHALLGLLERGYEFHDTPERVDAAKKELGFG